MQFLDGHGRSSKQDRARYYAKEDQGTLAHDVTSAGEDKHVEFDPARVNASAARRAVEAAPAPQVLGETESMCVGGRISVERIVIELEIPGDSRSLFRLRLDNKVVGENLTAAQIHLLVGGDSRPDYTAEASRERVRARKVSGIYRTAYLAWSGAIQTRGINQL